MAIDYQVLRFILASRRDGVSFEKTIMFGRQQFVASPKKAKALFKKYHFEIDDKTIEGFPSAYIEPLLQILDAREIVSVDPSNYEGATIEHDMNVPLPEALKNKFTAALDFGTLEHVFNYPQALKNAMESLRLDGHLMIVTNCNGWAGHGFYQFSPELFFRALSRDNGYQIENLFICEAFDGAKWYRCIDPLVLKRRVDFLTNCRTYLLIQAKRREVRDVFTNVPQQSDYVSLWTGERRYVPPLWSRLFSDETIHRIARLRRIVRNWAPGLHLARDAFPPFDR